MINLKENLHIAHDQNNNPCNTTLPPYQIIGVWPSEEVLAYYCMKNNYVFKQKTVLELGGGMTCLASFAVAKTSDAMLVACTDGNPASVENVKRIIEHNNLSSTCPIIAQ